MIKDSKKRVQISIDRERLKELKKIAVDKDVTLSELLIKTTETICQQH